VVRTALDELVGSYGSDERGIEIRAVAGGYRVYTKPQHHDVVSAASSRACSLPLRLTMPALETLAVIAYKQPATQPEIQEIRGVSCAGVIQTLLDRRLITTAGRKQVIGRPILYRTSKEFMMRFGLSDLDELPSLKEFEALAREALGTEDGVAESAPPAPSRHRRLSLPRRIRRMLRSRRMPQQRKPRLRRPKLPPLNTPRPPRRSRRMLRSQPMQQERRPDLRRSSSPPQPMLRWRRLPQKRQPSLCRPSPPALARPTLRLRHMPQERKPSPRRWPSLVSRIQRMLR
jgi:segregation and condensation protein B